MALVIFDCDGVLVDSEMLANGLLAEMMTELGRPMTTHGAIRIFGGRAMRDVLELAAGILGRQIPQAVSRRYGQRLVERLRTDLEPVAGVKAAIAALPHARCIASSSTFERIRLSLEVTGLLPLFDERVFSATQVPHGKPAPDLYLFAAASMGVAPHHCLVIEDSPLGIRAAVAAGMTAIGFTGANHTTTGLADMLAAAGARRVLSSMRALPATVFEFAS